MESVRLWACVAGVFAAVASTATVQAQPLRLTLDDALQKALAANSGYRAGLASVDAVRANLGRSGAWVPQNPYFTGGLLNTPQTGFGPNFGLSLSQEFEIAGQRSRRMAVAEAALRSAEWDQRDSENTLRAAVQSAFVRALVGRDRVTAAERGVAAVSELTSGAETEAVEEASVPQNQLVIQQARSRREVIGAQQEAADARDALLFLIGVPPGQEIELVGAVQTTVRPVPSDEDLVQMALRNRPDLIALQHEAERAEKQVPLVKREGIPNVTLSGSLSRFEDDTFAGGDLSFFLPVLRSHEPEVLQALAERDRAALLLEELKRNIEREVRQARRVVVVTGESLDLSQRVIVPRSRQNQELERRRFERGDNTAADLIGMMIDTQFAEREYLDAVQAYNDAWIELQRTVAVEL